MEKTYGFCVGCGLDVYGYKTTLRKRGERTAVICEKCASLTTHKPIEFDVIKGKPKAHGITAYITATVTKVDGIKAQAELLDNGFMFHGFGFRTVVTSSTAYGYNKVSKDLATLAYLADNGFCKVNNVVIHSMVANFEYTDAVNVHFNNCDALTRRYKLK